jgi:hypothetical protein
MYEKPAQFTANKTRFKHYDWETHKDKYKHKIAARRICKFAYNAVVKTQKKRVLALQLWWYGLKDVNETILRFVRNV